MRPYQKKRNMGEQVHTGNETREVFMTVSVIIPTLGRPRCVVRTAESLLCQDVKPIEIIIVEQDMFRSKSDELYTWVIGRQSENIKLRYFHLDEPNASRARNVGMREAQGEILIFLDDDVLIANTGFVRAHLKNYSNPAVAGVVGQILDPDKKVRLDRHPWSYRERVGWLYFPRNYGHRTRIESGGAGNMSVRRSVALAVRGMDERFQRGAYREESDFFARCRSHGYEFIYDPDPSLVHLSEPVGGIRSWENRPGLHSIHHVTGELYFILKDVLVRDYAHHLFCALRRQVFNRHNLVRPWQIPWAFGRMFRGAARAHRDLKQGPIYL